MPGNPLGSLCSVCNDPLAAAINQQLIEGVGANTIAKRFTGVSLDSIKRHRQSAHHTRSIAALAVAVPAEKAAILGESAALNAATLIEKSAELYKRAEAFVNRAEASGDMNAMAKALNTNLAALKLAAELCGAFPKAGTTIDARSVHINSLGKLSVEELRAIAKSASGDVIDG